MVSMEHGNFIVNDGTATARDVLKLIEMIKQRARAERGIELETEVEIIGEDMSAEWNEKKFENHGHARRAERRAGSVIAVRAGVRTQALALRSATRSRAGPEDGPGLENCRAAQTWCFSPLHGTYGEDGTVQRQLEKLGVPYTGCDAEASRVAFDKVLTKRRCIEAGIPTRNFGA